MLNVLSLLAGIVAFVFMLLGLIPLFGWVNWIMLPIAGVGILLGLLSSSNSGRNFCLVVAIIGGLRLWLGGGIL